MHIGDHFPNWELPELNLATLRKYASIQGVAICSRIETL